MYRTLPIHLQEMDHADCESADYTLASDIYKKPPGLYVNYRAHLFHIRMFLRVEDDTLPVHDRIVMEAHVSRFRMLVDALQEQAARNGLRCLPKSADVLHENLLVRDFSFTLSDRLPTWQQERDAHRAALQVLLGFWRRERSVCVAPFATCAP